MGSAATSTYALLRADVDTLMGLQTSPDGPQRSTDANEPLLRAAVVLLVTAWENYVEQAVAEAFEHVMTINDDPRNLSPHLQGAIVRAAKADVWTVTGDNWRTIVADEVADLIGKLNNAGSGKVDGLIKMALGIDSFLSRVSWPAYPPIDVGAELRSLVNEVRGEIVHKGRTPSALNVPGLEQWRSFVDKLVAESDVRVASEVSAIWGSSPW